MNLFRECNAPIGKACFYIIEGTVISQNTQCWSSTNISSTGGGGYVSPYAYGGYIAPPTITSTTSHHMRYAFWISDKNGKDTEFVFPNAIFTVTTGQQVRFIYGAKANNNTSPPTLLFAENLTSGIKYYFVKDDLWNWARTHNLANYPLIYRIALRWTVWISISYLLFVWLPLSDLIKQSNDNHAIFNFHDFIKLNLQWLPKWSSTLVFESWKKHSSSTIWLAMFFLLIAVSLFCMVLEWIGYLLIGRWWRLMILHKLRGQLSSITGSPAPTGMSHSDWVFYLVLTAAIAYFLSGYIPKFN